MVVGVGGGEVLAQIRIILINYSLARGRYVDGSMGPSTVTTTPSSLLEPSIF